MTQAVGPPPQVVVPGAGWVDMASRAIVQVGFPVVVAAVLLWWVLFRFEHQMELVTARLEANARAAAEMTGALKESLAMQRQWAADNVGELRKQTQELHDQTESLRTLAARPAKRP